MAPFGETPREHTVPAAAPRNVPSRAHVAADSLARRHRVVPLTTVKSPPAKTELPSKARLRTVALALADQPGMAAPPFWSTAPSRVAVTGVEPSWVNSPPRTTALSVTAIA